MFVERSGGRCKMDHESCKNRRKSKKGKKCKKPINQPVEGRDGVGGVGVARAKGTCPFDVALLTGPTLGGTC